MLRTIFFLTITVVSTGVYATLAIIVGLFKRYAAFSYYHIVKPWSELLLWASGTKVEVLGVENVDLSRPYVIVSNHQSNMDIPVLAAKVPMRITFIAKKELFKIPIFAQGMRGFGILEIDRSDRTRAFETLKTAAAVAHTHKLSILAFPEGTRSMDGQLKPFKKGPFVLAINAKLPVLPVSIVGTFPIMPKNTLRINAGQKVKLILHPPIDTENYTFEDRNQLIDKAHQAVAEGFYEYSEAIR